MRVAGRSCRRVTEQGSDGVYGRRRERAIQSAGREAVERLENRLLLADTAAFKDTMLDIPAVAAATSAVGEAAGKLGGGLTTAATSISADRFEPNDTFATATSLGALGYRAEAGLSIHAVNNDDYFQFTAAVSGLFSVDIAFKHAQGDLDLYVYDSAFGQLGKSAGATDSEHVAVWVDAGTSCFVQVTGFDGATNPDYSLTITPPNGPDRFEPNNSFAQASDLGTIVSRTESGLTIHAAHNADYYRFVPATSGLLNVDIFFVNAMGDLDLYLYDGGGIELDSSATTSNNEHVSYSVSAGSTYYVDVEGYRTATNPAYTLQIVSAPPAWLVDDGALTYSFSGPPSAPLLTVTGGHGRLAGDAGAAMPGLSILVSPEASLMVDVDQTLASVQVGDGGVFAVTPGTSRLLLVDSLSLAPTGQLDMADSDMVLKASVGSFDAIRQYIRAGQIITSEDQPVFGHFAAMAPVDNQLLHLTAWAGEQISSGVDFGQIIIKHAWLGDADLDGQVTQADYLSVIANQGKAGQWITGDLNGDGVVTADDLAVVSVNMGTGSGGVWGPPLAAQVLPGAMAACVVRPVATKSSAKKLRKISGLAFDDTNGDGVRQRTEKLRRDAVVYIDANGNGRLDAGERHARSDASGRYVFSDAPIGTYQVRLAVPARRGHRR